jgi:coenzyme PQQ precursor peptide PqqA
MTWTTPYFEEISVNCEINSYAPAAIYARVRWECSSHRVPEPVERIVRRAGECYSLFCA